MSKIKKFLCRPAKTNEGVLKMRKRNWREYKKNWFKEEVSLFSSIQKLLRVLHLMLKKRKKGRPLEFSDQFILILLMIKIHYKILYQKLEGFTRFFFKELTNGQRRLTRHRRHQRLPHYL